LKYFLQRTSDLVLISKPCARSGRMAPFYFPVKNARNERPLSQSDIGVKAKGTGLLVAIAEKLGASELVAPRAGKGRIDIALLSEAGITVYWLDYQRPVYPQLWGEFIKDLSAMDLLFNSGDEIYFCR